MSDRLLLRLLLRLKGRSNDAGFSFTELMFVIVIIGLLTAIALPVYVAGVNRTRTQSAETSIAAINLNQLRFFGERSRFATTLEELAAGIQPVSDDYTYSVSIVGEGITQYALAEATPDPSTVLPGVAGKAYLRQTSLGEIEVLLVRCTGEPGQIPNMTAIENETQCPDQ